MTGFACFLAEVGAAAGATPPSWHAWATAAILALVLVALISERVSPDLGMLSGLALLLVLGIVTPEQGLSGFSDPAMLAVGALFVVAAAVRQSGALTFLGRLMRPRSRHLPAALARVMLPSSLLSCFMNNTPIVAVLTPLVEGWGQRAGIRPAKLLMPLSFATMLGGMATLVGTSTNLVVSSQLERAGHAPFAMFELVWIGAPAALLGFVYFATIGHRLLPDGDEGPSATRGKRDYQFDLLVPASSRIVGQTIEAAGLRHLEDAFLAHALRHGELVGPIGPSHTLAAGDVLTFYGDTRVMDLLLGSGDLARVEEIPRDTASGSSLPALPLFEAVVSPESSLVGRTLKSSDFRERFQAVVLGIQRRGRRLEGPIGQSRIEAGDLLLIEARPNFESRWVDAGEFYLVAPIDRSRQGEAGRTLGVLFVVAALFIVVSLSMVPVVTAALVAAMLVVACGALRAAEARRAIDLSVLIVIASAFGIERAITASGLGETLGRSIVDLSSGHGPFIALALVYVATNVLTEFLTNSVAAALMFPIGLATAGALGSDPRAFAVAIAIAASASFATPIGYQTNMMVMSPGGYRFRDYTKVGLPLDLLVMIVALAIIRWRWL